MTTNWENFQSQILNIKAEFDRAFKCLNKTNLPSAATQAKHINILVRQHNAFATTLKTFSPFLIETHKFEAENIFKGIKLKLKNILVRLEISDRVPDDFESIFGLKIIEQDSDEEAEEEENLKKTPEKLPSKTNKMTTVNEFLNVVSKLIPEFDGSVEKLSMFINALTLIDTLKGNHEEVAVCLIKTKVSGRAQSLIGHLTTINSIKQELQSKIKAESAKAVASKLLALKQKSNENVTYAKEVEELSLKLEQAYI